MEPSVLASDYDEVNMAKESTMVDDTLPPSEDPETGSKATRDPLNWFGILVPPALRTAQSNFEGAVSDLVPALASISEEMKRAEIEVRKARKKIRKAV